MTPGDHYRSLSSRFSARARSERNLKFRAEWLYLASCYRRLAEQADRNQLTDIAYEPPLKSEIHDGQSTGKPLSLNRRDDLE